jgi:HPt (histidine-containing phosphotransfer) domain-containing protein
VELFERTLHALHEQDRKLAQALAEGDPAATRGLHGYRGLAAMLGAPRLAALAAEGEQAVAPDADWQRRFLECREVDLAALDRLCAHLSSPVAPAAEPLQPAPPGSLADHLDTLADLLAGSDLEALDAHEALRSELPPEVRVPLDDAMAALDFTTALTLCHDLRATLEPRP